MTLSCSFFQPHYIVGWHRLAQAFERQFSHRFNVCYFFDRGANPLANKDLPGACLGTQAGSQVDHCADRAVIKPTFVSDLAKGGISIRNTDAKAQTETAPFPTSRYILHA